MARRGLRWGASADRASRQADRGREAGRSRPVSRLRQARRAQHEFAARGVVLVCAVGLAGAATLQLLLTERLGAFFGCCFVLASLTAALTVRPDGFFTVGILPPLLLVGVLTVVAKVQPTAIDAPGLADDAGLVQRVIAGVVSQAAALVTGHALAIGVLGIRIGTAPED